LKALQLIHRHHRSPRQFERELQLSQAVRALRERMPRRPLVAKMTSELLRQFERLG
jgi:hypothetical protein